MNNQQPTTKEIIIQLLETTKRPGIVDLIRYLESSDFFTAPASTRFHGCYEGGLADHCLNVYNCLVFLTENLKDSDYVLPEVKDDSIILVSLLHDLCKVNTYQPVQKWRKDAQGKWEDYIGYDKNPLMPMGHGAKSVFIANQFINLSKDEALAIFWHMGPYDISDYMTRNELGQAFTESLLAFLLHQADMMATYISENENYQ